MPKNTPLTLRGFPEIIALLNCSLVKRKCRHAECHFVASIQEGNAETCLDCLGKTISLESPNGSVFNGRIEKVSVQRSYAATHVRVTAMSLSILDDVQPKTRIFHNPDKKWGDVLNRLSLGQCSLDLDRAIADLPCPEVVLQYQESNFQFLSRMATRIGCPLWIDDTREKPTLCLKPVFSTSKLTLGSELLSFWQTRQHACPGEKQGETVWQLSARDYFPLGSMVQLELAQNATFVVVGIHIEYRQAIWNYAYDLEPENAAPQSRSDTLPSMPEKTVRLHARVTSAEDPEHRGRIRVNFDDKFIEDMDTGDNALWIPYRSPYSGKAGGMVFLPDADDEVEIFFSNGEVFAASTLRGNELPDECRNVRDKYLGNNSLQRIFWKENSLEILSGENSIILDDKCIRIKVGENSIFVGNDGNNEGILLKTHESSMHLSGDIVLKTSGKSELEANNMEMMSKNDLKLKAAKAELEGSSSHTVTTKGTLTLQGSKVNLCH